MPKASHFPQFPKNHRTPTNSPKRDGRSRSVSVGVRPLLRSIALPHKPSHSPNPQKAMRYNS
ncbi:MAG: hypothetical protein HC836_20460 [Richelia sp. RM2_1_2]|nr:hypothetical protein [Richelia sp. RM2_1_2]